MNAHLLQSYLDGQLSHEEESRLRLDLLAKPSLSNEERAVLLLLSSAVQPDSIDENWWSEAGCDAFDAILANETPVAGEKIQQDADSSMTKLLPSESVSSPPLSQLFRWQWAVAAAVVLALGIGLTRYVGNHSTDEIASVGETTIAPFPVVPPLSHPSSLTSSNPRTDDEVVVENAAPTDFSALGGSGRRPRPRGTSTSLETVKKSDFSDGTSAVSCASIAEQQAADRRLEEAYLQFREAEAQRTADLYLELDYLHYRSEQSETTESITHEI